MPHPGPVPEELRRVVADALREDLRSGDVTSAALVPEASRAGVSLVFREEGVAAGLPALAIALALLDPAGDCHELFAEGDLVPAGAVAARGVALARAVLAAERTALNVVGRLSGIATLTAGYVRAVKGTRARIYDTRKTTPTLRALEKYAVRAGGGANHRFGLHDMALVKDNHLELSGKSPGEAARLVKGRVPVPVEVEVTDVAGAVDAARGGADIVMLDNMTPELAAEAVRAVRALFPEGRPRAPRPPEIEISGGVRLDNALAYALSGADRISVGALTHSAKALDVALDVRRLEP